MNNTVTIPQNNFVGIDVSKDTLDVFVVPVNKHRKFTSDAKGHQKLITFLKSYDPKIVVFEASGGYEIELLLELQKNNFNIWRVEPRRITGFKKSEGIYAKTDISDAKVLAQYGAEKKQKYQPRLITKEELKLQALSRRKDDLREFLKGEKTRLQQVYDLECKQLIEKSIEFLELQIKAIEVQMKELIENNNEWHEQARIAQSMKGVGFGLTIKLLVDLKELGSATNQEIAALAGVAPYANESGKFKGHSFIRGGRAGLRKDLYMAALSAAFHNPVLARFYQKLLQKGKKAKVALIAVARKMLVILNAMFRKQEVWKEV